MGIIPYQAFFFLSVMLMFAVGRHLRASGVEWWAWVPRAWVGFCVIFTMVNVFMPALMFFQLGVIAAATWWSLNLMRAADTERHLERVIEQARRELSAEQAKLLEMVPLSAIKLIGTQKEHEQVLDETIAQAQRSICITSGGINHRAMSSRRVKGIERALKRGVHVFLAFGYQSSREEPKLSRDSYGIVKRLHELSVESQSREGGGKLLLAHVPVHSKLLVRDDSVAVVGSSNWLSNSSFVNMEHSTVIRDRAVAASTRDTVMKIVREADAGTIPRLLAKAEAEAGAERRLAKHPSRAFGWTPSRASGWRRVLGAHSQRGGRHSSSTKK